MTEKKYCIDIEMTDGGKLITSDQANDFITKYVVNQQVAATRQRVARLICFTHYEFPDVETANSDSGALVIRVKCCCNEFLEVIDQRFQ